jgi:methylmalonyl-CoA mutase cobalamin-binding subunit
MKLKKAQIFPEPKLPIIDDIIEEARNISQGITVGECPFLVENEVKSECDYKKKKIQKKELMFHGQIGYRDLAKTTRAYQEIYQTLKSYGYHIDRYGICLDWSMGYPSRIRETMPKGTGLILKQPEDFVLLTESAPVAPHFGDFMIGTPASVENTISAIKAGSTSIGNIGQYFTFRMPQWRDDVETTIQTIKAISICASQPVEFLIHSNLDDGFAALFTDISCTIGAVLLERYIIEDLLEGNVSHCYGHTFSEPLTRLAFQRALFQVIKSPGSMIYGNTTIYVKEEVENYANLASYFLIDLISQITKPTGHGLNPVPVSEAIHIPEIDEIINAHQFAHRLSNRAEGFEVLFDFQKADQIANKLIKAGTEFKHQVLSGFEHVGIDIKNPFELLLAFRRLGAKKLEELYGPGKPDKNQPRGRIPVIQTTTLKELEQRSKEIFNSIGLETLQKLKQAELKICIASTDVHEYGKILVENVLNKIGILIVDGGVSSDPDVVAKHAISTHSDFIAISTYSGVALKYINKLLAYLNILEFKIPIFIGGKLNQIPEESSSSLPKDVTTELQTLGVFVCHRVEDMIDKLIEIQRSNLNGK